MNPEQVTACLKKGRGRPKQFDRDIALDKALDLFWRHGYEATSMSDLVEATGAKAPTLYAEFGNKEGLFKAAVDRYVARFAEKGKALLNRPGSTVHEAIECFFRAAAHTFTDKSLPSGCFIICTSAALSASSEEVARMLKCRHHLQENTLREFLLARQSQGEIDARLPVAALAKYLACTLQGMSVQARDGASRQELDTIVSALMSVWPALTHLSAEQLRQETAEA
ncbi:TetR/AcrR family transcriptional regulator [Martelella alba]|uniref:TetR/AcrR family transcriptional regulator n=1 Tax=Martelella alba TaxID=2590451 RepID=A0ABY2SMJ1_9HYPH|nr:TetR/AcrR family transcriptional regulator [Martelella alba]TKI06147.1 TetR/AcrR family transcriptional regulator [Martelella alba]